MTRITILVLASWLVCGCASVTPPESASNGESAGIVVCASSLAAEVGRDVLARGGNAIDAAVAVGFALAVTYPQAGNIGGGGFMVVRFADGRKTTLDFRETAPRASHPGMFTDESGAYSEQIHHWSHLSVGVPGTVAGLAHAHGAWGRSGWRELVDPAIRLADEGVHVTPRLERDLRRNRARLGRWAASRAVFTRDGEPWRAGDLFRQPDLARSLERIRDRGAQGFYGGETAALVIDEMRRGGGLMTAEDLELYRPIERAPVTGTFHDWGILSMGPPSSGGVALVQMLNILEGFDLAAMRRDSAGYVHILVEAMRIAYRDRARHLGDADFVSVPVERLTSKEYAAALRATIPLDRAGTSDVADVAPRAEGASTTHYSVIDEDGTAVSVTYTLEYAYGSGITVPGAGFLLNNEMGDFNPLPGMTTEKGHVGTAANLVEPGKRMVSSMTPTIITRDGEVVAVVGSPGGRTIINTVLQVILNLTVHGMHVDDAVAARRIHHQWLPRVVRVERGFLSPGTLDELRAMGHELKTVDILGKAHCIGPGRDGRLAGAADPRDHDAAACSTTSRNGLARGARGAR